MPTKDLLRKLDSIKNGWDLAAIKDPICYIMGSEHETDLDLKSFFDLKAQQAKQNTEDFFRKTHFTTAGKRMLDIGCGIGAMTRYFSEIFAETHGVDISEEMIKRALELNKDRPNLSFNTSNGVDLSIYEDNFFDFCFSFATLQYFPSKVMIENCFKEITRVLKPKGLFKVQLDGRKWVASRTPILIYRPLYNFMRNSYFLTLFGRLITDSVTVKAYRGRAISWKTVVNILLPLPLADIRITGKNTNQMWVSGRKN
jgi:ubiquinone/menaquinone biosynthesis C-methylase UbiE